MKCLGLAAIAAAIAFSGQAALVISEESASPVRKVITLLQDLQKRIEADEELDQKAYEKYKCWCDKVEEEKAKTITQAATLIKQLIAQLSSNEAKKVTLDASIAKNTADQEDNQKKPVSQGFLECCAKKKIKDDAFKKKWDAFTHQQAEEKQVVASLIKAIAMLSDPDFPPSLLQEGQEKSSVRSAVQDVIDALPIDAHLEPKALQLLSQAATSYAPAMSASVVYIMEQLEAQYKTDLSALEDQGKKDKEDYEASVADIKATLQLLATQRIKLDGDLATVLKDIADDTKLKEDTELSKATDESFLQNATVSCRERQAEFSERNLQRSKEMQGVDAALQHLTSEGARLLTNRAIKTAPGTAPSFLQIGSSDLSAMEQAYHVLNKEASEAQSQRLKAIAGQVKRLKELPGGGFTQVLESIDNMISQLENEEKTDKEKKAYCNEEYHKIDKEISKSTFLVQKNDALIGRLETKVDLRTEEKAKAASEIAENKKVLEQMQTIRAEEQSAFFKEKSDDTLSIKLLTETRAKLAAFYYPAAGDSTGFAQVKEDPGMTNEELEREHEDMKLTDKYSNKGAADMVLALLDRIVDNLEVEISEGSTAENTSAAEYEEQKATLEETNEDLENRIIALEGMVSDRQLEINEQEEAKTSNQADITGQENYKNQIKDECDFFINNFDERYGKRTTEMQGLRNAKYLLENSQPRSFFQIASHVLGKMSSLRWMNN